MVSEFSVILVTNESETAEAVSVALGSESRISLSGVCANLSALVPHLKKTTVSAALIDISGQPAQMLKKLNPIIRRFYETHFIMLNDELQNDLILEAMKAGARYFLPKESISDTLLHVLQTFLADKASRETSHRGIVTTFLSASGGCGSTTLAVNLANELQLLNARPTLLMDLDTAYGGALPHTWDSPDNTELPTSLTTDRASTLRWSNQLRWRFRITCTSWSAP